MLTPDTGKEALGLLTEVLLSVPRREKIIAPPPVPSHLSVAMTPRTAIFSAQECIPVSNSVGRILASASVGCPPAVPIAISGEVIDDGTRDAFSYYGIDKVAVVKK